MAHLGHNEKRRLFQQHLTLLLHAHDCAKREQNIKSVGMLAPNCGSPLCDNLKQILKHLDVCTAAGSLNNCGVSHCLSYRTIIRHWKSCNTRACTLCGPKLSKHQNNSYQKPRSDAFRKDFESLFFPLNLCTRPGADWRFSINSPKNTLRQQIIDNIVNSLFPNHEIFSPPQPFIVPSLQHLIGQKIVNAILPNKKTLCQLTNPKTIVIDLCFDYAANIEEDMFDYAESFDEYYDEIVNDSVDEFICQFQFLLKTSVIFPESEDLREWFFTLGYRPLYQPKLAHLKNAFATFGFPFSPATTFEPDPDWRISLDYAFRTSILNKFMTSNIHVPIARRAKFQIESKNMESGIYNRAKSLAEYCYLMASELSRNHAWAINESKRCFRQHEPYALEAPH